MRMQTKCAILVLLTCSVFLAACDSDDPERRLLLQLFATPASIPVDGTSIITVGVFDSSGRPVPDVGLNWQTTLGALEVTAGNTNANGRQTATFRGTGVAGTAIITVITSIGGHGADTPVRIGLD
jgi:hypothetical protein